MTAAVVLWNTVYLERAAYALRGNEHTVDDVLLQYLSPLGWRHIKLTGDYLFQCAAGNCVQYHTTLDVTMTMLLKTTLRMRPDRIVVGEVRGPEALDLLDAWNTGHEGGVARFSLTDEGRATSQNRGIFACAKTGYVVLCIEPGGQGRPARPCSGLPAPFPTLTGVAPLAAGQRATPAVRRAAAAQNESAMWTSPGGNPDG